MNGTDKPSEQRVYPEEAAVISISVIILYIIGLIGLLKEHIVWIVTFGLLSVLFQVLRIYSLFRSWFTDQCVPGVGSCFQAELLNTTISIIEIIITFMLAFEIRSKQSPSSGEGNDDEEKGSRDLRTTLPTSVNASGIDQLEELETSLTIKRGSKNKHQSDHSKSGLNDEMKHSARLFKIPNLEIEDWS